MGVKGTLAKDLFFVMKALLIVLGEGNALKCVILVANAIAIVIEDLIASPNTTTNPITRGHVQRHPNNDFLCRLCFLVLSVQSHICLNVWALVAWSD